MNLENREEEVGGREMEEEKKASIPLLTIAGRKPLQVNALSSN